MTIKKLPLMDAQEIEKIIKDEKICRIAFMDGEFPYIAPFQYLFIGNKFYFHLTNYGRKKEILSKNNNVCVSVEQFTPNMNKYYFISIQGKLNPIYDEKLKMKLLENLFKQAKLTYSNNFLTVHGFNRDEDWDKFKADNSLTLFEFNETHARVGLRSEL